jgi:hypothetical protein
MPLPARDARAKVAALLTLDELFGGSTYVVAATAGERRSAWEDLPSGRCIVTYTKLTVERAVVGTPGSDCVVNRLDLVDFHAVRVRPGPTARDAPSR